MKTCMLSDFMESLKPWLSKDYIQMAYLNKNDHLVLSFRIHPADSWKMDPVYPFD